MGLISYLRLKMSGDKESAAEQLREERARAANLEEELRKTKENSKEELRKTREELEANKTVLNRVLPGKSDYVAVGSFTWDVKVANIEEENIIFSEYTSVGGASFRLGCRKEEEHGEKWLAAYLYCNDSSASKTHSTMAEFTVTLASPKCPSHKSSTIHFLPSRLNHSWFARSWQTLVSPAREHVQNGCITLEAHIKVIFSYKNNGIDFTSPDPDLSDVVLLVGGREFNVSRNFLAHYCGYFKALFCSNFAEKNKEKIELKEMDADEFEAMLDVIYPQRKKATVATVNGLLRMADFFDVHVVRMECTEFLLASADFTLVAKLKISEEFRLLELQYHLMESLKQADDLQKVIDSADFECLSATLQKSLLEKHFKLSRK